MLCAYGKKNQYVDKTQQRCNDNEKNVKDIKKMVDFSMGICYYNTRLERQGKTY